jgi:hypothetical protein
MSPESCRSDFFTTLHRNRNREGSSTLVPDIVIIADEVDAQLKQQVLRFMAADDGWRTAEAQLKCSQQIELVARTVDARPGRLLFQPSVVAKQFAKLLETDIRVKKLLPLP